MARAAPLCISALGLDACRWEQGLLVCWASVQVQALAHIASGELPTLAQLPSISGELAHTSYFPLLLLHACREFW